VPPARPLRILGVLAAGILVYASLAITSMRTTSAVYDETAHLPAGYTYLTLRDFRMNPEHPPLAKELAALPLLLMDLRMPNPSPPWALGQQWEFGHRFLYQWNDGDRVLFWGRLPMVALGCVLGAAVLLWTQRHFGLRAGAIAFFLCVLSPDVLAHGQIVTTDLAVTLFVFLSVIAFQAVTHRITALRVLLAGLATGAAFASKFSAIVLVPTLSVLAVAGALSPGPMTLAPFAATPRKVSGALPRLAALALALLAIGAIALAFVWATYGFHPRLANDPEAAAAFSWARLERPGAASGALRTVRAAGLLPDAYVYGLATAIRDAEARPAFLFGHVSPDGWWYYFPATFLLKTPLALLGLLALPLFARREEDGRREAMHAFLWLPVAIYVGVTLTRHLNIGHRHLLPIYPFLFAAAGSAAAAAVTAGRGRRWAVLALSAWYAVSVLHVHPHYLGYFNELVGGPSQGWRYLVDSNVDWGQDLKALKSWTDEHAVTHLKLSYFGSADPAYYRIPCEMLPSKMHPDPPRAVGEVRAGELVAVSATNLQGVYFEGAERHLMNHFRALTPIDRVGYSIFIFRSDFSVSLPVP
jgi:4-amino-4-deoxy-L-arabinose transferase-like glycosyltransferase